MPNEDDPNVDRTDLGLRLNNFGFESASTAAVPEPTSIALALLTLCGLAGKMRQRGE